MKFSSDRKRRLREKESIPIHKAVEEKYIDGGTEREFALHKILSSYTHKVQIERGD